MMAQKENNRFTCFVAKSPNRQFKEHSVCVIHVWMTKLKPYSNPVNIRI